MPDVSVQPLLAQHRDKRGQQRHQQTCIQEVRGRDDLLGWATPRRRSGGVFVGSNGSVEAEENRSEVSFGPFGGIWLELGLDVDDESGADRREETSLRTRSAPHIDEGNTGTHENQGGIEILVVFLHVFGVVFRRLSFVHCVEVERGVVGLLYAIWSQFGAYNLSCRSETYHRGSTLTGFAFSSPLIVVSYRGGGGGYLGSFDRSGDENTDPRVSIYHQ